MMRKQTAVLSAVIAGVLAFGMPAWAAKGKTSLTSKSSKKLVVSGQIQWRYSFVEGNDGEDSTSEFGFNRVRLAFAGDLSDTVFYQFRMSFDDAPTDDDKGAVGLSSTYIGYRLGSVGDVRLGRWKVTSWHIPSSKRKAFTEDATHIRKTNINSQKGILWSSGKWFEGRAHAQAGMFNGNGDTLGNDNNSFMYMARFGVSPNKKFKFTTESDLKHSDWGIGLRAGGSTNLRDEGADESEEVGYGVALMLRGKGLYAAVSTSKETRDYDAAEEEDEERKGWSAQVSYAIPMPNKMFIEPKVRYEQYEDDSEDLDDEARDHAWTTVGVNLFIEKFNASFHADYIMKAEKGDADTLDNNMFILQANLLY